MIIDRIYAGAEARHGGSLRGFDLPGVEAAVVPDNNHHISEIIKQLHFPLLPHLTLKISFF
ncbi:MAG: hypothetical protein K9I69_09250 [Ignavibacteriales bacterium]|nr:hypothetical protein [Ignavibacteriales bacterium]MCF8307129.1 hypothetical protein [Ignavibacteriales bacterium]MCF8316715.1 hypothetical protein [Ignavibacteriales bacterium]MCF8436051.1 hypothetical protein [Ignavibacteriales bacterium]